MPSARSLVRAATRFAAVALFASSVLVTGAVPAHAVKRIYLANDEHTDYFWTADDVTYRTAFLGMLDFYMAQAESTVSNPVDSRGRFNADCSLWMWEYERNRTPAQFARLMNHVRAGNISMPLNNAVLCYGGSPAEAVLRSMYYAGRLERRFGLRFPLAVAMENQTLPAGLASLWAGSGALYSWRGVCGCATRTSYAPRPREIYRYVGPDGQGVTMKWNTMTNGTTGIGGYLEASSLGNMVTHLESGAFAALWPYPDVSAAFGYGGDALDTRTTGFLTTSMQKSNANRRVIVSNEVDFFEDFLATYGASLPTFSGSFGNEWELYQASMGNTTARFRRALEKLRTAEALATIATQAHPAFMAGRESARDLAFMAAGLYYEHDWTADGPVARSVRAQFQRDQLALLEAYVNTLQSDALAQVAADVAKPGAAERHLVFNPLSWVRTDYADLTTSVAAPRRVIDVASGAEVPSQTLPSGALRIRASAVPSVGYRVYEVQPGAPAAWPASASVLGAMMDDGRYAVTLGTRGQLTSVVDHRDGDRNLVAAGSWLNDLATGNGTVSLESSGPVSTTLRVSAPSTPAHTTRVTLYAGVDRVEIENTITANFSGLAEYFSRFNLTAPTVRHEEVGMIATAARAAAGGDYADANTRTDYLTFGHFADFSEAARGVTLSNADCSFFQLGASTTTTLDAGSPQIRAVVGMQVDGTAYGILNQGGDTQFLNRFALQRHGTYDPAAAMRFSLEHQNPFVSARLTGAAAGPLPADTLCFVRMPSPDVLLWALKPADDGAATGTIVRVWNLANAPRTFSLSLPRVGEIVATHTTHIETDVSGAVADAGVLTDALARQEMATYRIRPMPEPTDTGAGAEGRVRGLNVFPNPSARVAAATIAFRLSQRGAVRVRVMDVRGAVVATLHDGVLEAGDQQLTWDRRDGAGRALRSGVYFVVADSGGRRVARRLALVD
ncbi:MAG: glycoside hydrolase [Candidatus Eisenbacteria bacterium]|uniref:Glycoside hydrolase n=1 Tax=Eiseniibacteriota bacterium TaxID=2212470 RepID=A0A933WA13_UNCEI|nr:glycoside hydrolase [Candidatus Eisenbacteria bacterium]